MGESDGVDLAIAGVRGQVGGKLRAGGVDGGLHVAGGAVDVAVEVELHGDASVAGAGGRRHLVDAGDAGELALERRGDGGGHGFGVGAGKVGADGDGGELDLRERGDREQLVGDAAGEDDREREQERRDGALDEGRGEVDGVDAVSERLALLFWRRRLRAGLRGAVAVAVVVVARRSCVVAGRGASVGLWSPGWGLSKLMECTTSRCRRCVRDAA